MIEKKIRYMGLLAFGITILIFYLYSLSLRLTFSQSSLHPLLQFYCEIGKVLIFISGLVLFPSLVD